MPLIEKDQMSELLADQKGACLSLFMPLERDPDKAQKNHIRLKNMYKSVESQLATRPVQAATEKEILAPVAILLEDGRLPRSSKGLALFANQKNSQTFFFPHTVPEHAIIDKQFHIKPLSGMVAKDSPLYILTLSQNQVRLFRANLDSIEQVNPDALPESIDEALAYEDPEKRQQYHTSTDSPQAIGGQPAVFHAHHPEAEKKSRLRRFFQQIDAVLVDNLNTETGAPLVLAGVDYLLPIYREANTYPHLLAEEIVGNVEHLAPHELHERAQGIMNTQMVQAQEADLKRFAQLTGSKLVSADLTAVVAAAYYGRIDTLFVSQNNEQWGSFDPQTGETQQTDAVDGLELTNFACRHTLLNSGTVHLLPTDDMPAEANLVAIFRYTLDE